MSKVAAVLACLIICAASTVARPPATPTLSQSPDDGLRVKEDALRWMLAHGYAGPPGAQVRDAAGDPTDVLHYDLDIEVDVATHWIAGTCTMQVRTVAAGVDTFRFGLHNVFDISAVRVDGVAVAWSRVDATEVDVTLGQTYAADAEFNLSVDYAGYASNQGTLGALAFRTRGDAPEGWTKSETWFAHTWWPCKDVLDDKATARLRFTVPRPLRVASNGALTAVDDVGTDRQRFTWETNYPTATYLICFGITNYNVFESTWTYDGVTMPLQFYIYPEHDSAGHRTMLLHTAEMLTAFSDRFGIYPFTDEKYGIYDFGFPGGMEHQTFTGQGTNDDWLTAHELAHQWWGDNITCATWHDIWLNEGLATYSEALWFESQYGPVALHQHMARRRPSNTTGTVYCYDISDPARILSADFSYRKGAWVVHMLRWVLGDARFFATLAAYRAQFGGGSATTAEFQTVCESVAGENMDWFFEPWVYRAGRPYYWYGWQEQQAGGRTFVELHVRQRQREAWPLFRMPLEFVLHDARGGTESHIVWNDARTEHLLVPTRLRDVTAVECDPTGWILASAIYARPFEAGPPKITATWPAGATAAVTANFALAVQFHEPVTLAATDFMLTDAAGTVVPCTLAYDAATFAAVLTPDTPPAPGTYILTVADTVLGTEAGLALDGEVNASLPSGDGVPGGAFTLQFTTVAPLVGDANCDGVVDVGDVDAFVEALYGPATYAAAEPFCEHQLADLNGDGHVDFFDIDPFVAVLLGG